MKSENKKEIIITKEYYQKCKDNKYNFNDFPELLNDLKDEDPVNQFKGLTGIVTICEEEKKADEPKNFYNDLLPYLYNFIKNYQEEFQFEAIKCLAIITKLYKKSTNNILAIPPENAKDLIDIFLSFIINHKNLKLNIFIPTLKFLGIISCENNISNILFKENIKDKIMEIIKDYPKDLYVYKKCIKALNQIFKKKDLTESYAKISEDVIQILYDIINNYSEETKLIICSLDLIITLTQTLNQKIFNKIVSLNLLQKIIEFTNVENNDLIYNSLRIIGNFAMNEDSIFTEKLLEINVIDILKKFLDKKYEEKIRKESSFTLSNIAAGTQNQVVKLYESNIFPILSDIIITEPESDIKINCLWTIYNFSCIKNKEYLDELVQNGLMKIIVDRFNVDKGNTLGCSLEALDNLMKYYKNIKDPANVNCVELEIINLDIFESIKNLKKNNNEELCQNKINNILRDYFGVADPNSI